MNTGHHDDISVSLGGLLRERQGVARDVGNAMIDFGRLVVVRQDDGILLFLEFVDRRTGMTVLTRSYRGATLSRVDTEIVWVAMMNL
jgi:hypothetical protein